MVQIHDDDELHLHDDGIHDEYVDDLLYWPEISSRDWWLIHEQQYGHIKLEIKTEAEVPVRLQHEHGRT